MHVVVVGGAGRVGRRVVTELLATSEHRISIADRVAPKGLMDERVRFVEVDLISDSSLDAALREADVVVNTAGPFDVWGTVVLDAAINAGADYIDVCDDPEPTLALLDRHAQARDAGVRAVVGLGVSPGLTNYLAVIAARTLDRTDLLATFWGNSNEGMDAATAAVHARALSASFAEGRAAYTHLITQTSSDVLLWRGGELTRERAWRAKYRVTTSAGETGLYRVIGHPEPVTVPRTVPTMDCINIGTVNAGTDQVMLPYLERVAAGEIDENQALQQIARKLAECPQAIATPLIGPPLPRNIGAAAVGATNDQADGVLVLPGGPVAGSMSLETARPAVVGVLHIEDVAPGVHAPETAFDAEDYLSRYAATFWDSDSPYLIDRVGPTALVEVER
ncbi:saccharopine dehydrogenase NADP-binding domain-containing protein [Nocardia africana]|uniref:NADH-flavin reductase n=1 Tax=Nocardia africana TaxID=134964 RepID=A0A378WX62_9NOCA|nr:saccharopine dehydrogenase NADP-binding domain-containing protein [Nocardia africana]MCC3313714.1 saccharopine dehydrogenase NADP-binding domain-containing protein [Nocardia africana]SUA44903.1 Putative NADH-flavin reductase [Nocardia africana]